MIRAILIYSCLLLSTPLLAQNYLTQNTVKGKTKKQYESAKAAAVQENYTDALRLLDKLRSSQPTFIDAHLLYAQIKYEQEDLPQAKAAFQNVLELDPKYSNRIYYMLGVTTWKLDEYTQSIKYFEQYLASKARSSSRRSRAERYLANATFAQQALKNPVPFQPKALSVNINSPQEEYLPSITADGQQLFFTRVIGERTSPTAHEDFYISQKENGQWQIAQPITEINTSMSEGGQSISANGKLLVFTACNRPNGFGRCDIFFSERRAGHWTTPQAFPAPINTKAWESLPSLSADGNTLYFSSDRASGKGKRDLWYAQRLHNGNWSTPQNLAILNTSFDEQSPFIHPDGETLYFMSNGHPGMGSDDLYLSRKQPDGNWGKPQNLGYPINTKGQEGALHISLDGQEAFFASNRLQTKGDAANNDIYTFSLPPSLRPKQITYVRARIRDAQTKQLLPNASIIFTNQTTGKEHIRAKADAEGEFLSVLPIGVNFGLYVEKEGYLFHSEHFELQKTATAQEAFELDVELQAVPKINTTIEENKPIVLKNVFFETNSAELRDESQTELERLRELLQTYTTLQIQINGHTDNVGKETANQQLSQARAKTVYNYLIQRGISSERLRYKGFGETTPITTNETKKGRQTNRRTEFLVIQS